MQNVIQRSNEHVINGASENHCPKGDLFFSKERKKKTETANLALACSRRSDGGERFIAFFTLHRSLLSERLEQANLARIFLLDAIDRLVVAWP